MQFLIMDHTGHSTLSFSKTKAGMKEAMAKFRALIEEEKNVASVRTGEGSSRLVRDPGDLRPDDEVLFHRQLVGG